MSEGNQRRLTTIVAADIAGFSRLVGVDEEATLAAQRGHRTELIEPLLLEHHGRIANTAGDSFLLEFPSTVEAVRYAVAVQEGMVIRNEGTPENRRITYRIGINVGDVVADGEDLLGDGVNIAARLEGLCDPGGIVLSDDAYRQIRDRIGMSWEDGGEHEVKNIARPIQIWRWLEFKSPTIAISAETGKLHLSLHDKPSIAVLPFDNMSSDVEQDYFADGITEDIITELSRFQELLVIARNTTFTYKGRKIDVKEVARELDAHFVLEGSVRKSGARIRITAQLLDGSDGRHIWAERYDGELADVFDLQEQVTREVVSSTVPQLTAAELEHIGQGNRRFDEAQEFSWRALDLIRNGMRDGDLTLLEQAIEFGKKAVAINPRCSLAYSSIIDGYWHQALFRWGDDPDGAAEQSRQWSMEFLAKMPNSNWAYFHRGMIRSYGGESSQAIGDMEHALALNPNETRVLQMLAFILVRIGEIARGKEYALLADRLSPKDPHFGGGLLALAMAAFVERDRDAFERWAEKAIRALPTAPIRRALMIAHAAETGDQRLMEIHREVLMGIAPNFISSIFEGSNMPFERTEHAELLLSGLRKAGFS
jgi:adenylate cyclase